MPSSSEMAEPNDPPIIITGGSVTLQFDSSQLTPAGNGKHSNAGKKIKHVTVERGGTKVYDEDVPDGRVTITVSYGNDRP